MLCASLGVPVCLKEKHNARKAVWFTKATVIGAISAFVDSIDSHIILRMIRESKNDTNEVSVHVGVRVQYIYFPPLPFSF